MIVKRKKSSFSSIKSLLGDYDLEKNKYITKEFQDYGCRLSAELNDEKRTALYIKLAKQWPREILEAARGFVKDASGVRSKARLFMWKIKQLKDEKGKKQ